MFLCKYVVYILVIRKVLHCGMADYPLNPVSNTFRDKMISDILNPLVKYCLIGAPCNNIPLCSLTQEGAIILGKSSGWIKILWSRVDLGSNSHIFNDDHVVHNGKVSCTSLRQVSGSEVPIISIGEWPVVLGHSLINLPETLVIPGNPTSTIGGTALIYKSKFKKVTHQINLYFRIEQMGQSYTFSVTNDTLRTYNGHDYIPVLDWIPTLPPTARTRDKQSNVALII